MKFVVVGTIRGVVQCLVSMRYVLCGLIALEVCRLDAKEMLFGDYLSI